MKFRALDAKMRVYETAHDHCVLPGLYMVARIDGRGFTRLVRDVLGFDAPYDERFRDHMVATTEELMRCGLHVRYGYTHSDEISILIDRHETGFGRKLRKLNSILAGTASAAFSLRVGQMATFDCRISQLPGTEKVIDYFRWRSEDAHRNALNGSCYWALRESGMASGDVTKRLQGLSMREKHELLSRDHGVDFDAAPDWYKRGVGLVWETYEKELPARDGEEPGTVTRRRIKVIHDLPVKDEYNRFVQKLVVARADSAPRP